MWKGKRKEGINKGREEGKADPVLSLTEIMGAQNY